MVATPEQLLVVEGPLVGIRLADFLERHCPASHRVDVRSAVAGGRVRVNGMPAQLRQRLRIGDVVQLEAADLAPRPAATVPPAVLHESATALVIDKPAGVPTLAERHGRRAGVHELLPSLRPGLDLRIVHRLDRDTSGCLALAIGVEAARHFDRLFRSGGVAKTYVAVVDGVPARDEFTIDAWLGPDRQRPGKTIAAPAAARGLREAHTNVRVLRRFARHALLELRPTTGRSHQLRVHLASIGHPIVHDADYGGSELMLSTWKRGYKLRPGVRERPLLRRMFLHAERLAFEALDGERVDVRSPLPSDLAVALRKLESFAEPRN